MLRTIVVAEHNPKWTAEFNRIRVHLMSHTKDLVLDILHVGSTAVPQLAAKPILDIDIVFASYEQFPLLAARLETLGYQHAGDGGIPTRERFTRPPSDDFYPHHLYACPADSPELARHLLFRDHLRSNVHARNEYAALKQALAEQHRHDIDAYVAGKSQFIEVAIAEAQALVNIAPPRARVH